MKIRTLQVRNFRSLADANFEFPDLVVLVGKNDAGKTNVLDCLQVLCEGTASTIRKEDFYDPGQHIEIRATFEGVREYLQLCDNRNRPRVEERIHDGDRITIRRLAAGPGELSPIEIKAADSEEFGRPTGIDAALRTILPDIIYIDVLADVADQLKGTQKDALGKLMKQVVQDISETVQPVIAASMRDADRMLNVDLRDNVEVDNRVPELSALEREITGYLQSTFPAARVRLRVNMPTVKEVLAAIDVRVLEQGNDDPVYRRGSGLQRVLYLSLLRALAERIGGERAAVRKPFLLLFEEPEAFLHPEAQLNMRDVLKIISRSPNAQVLFTTHSPLLVTSDFIENTIRVHRCATEGLPKHTTRRHGPIQIPAEERDLIRIFAVQRSSRFLFARAVLLVEGVADEHLFAAAAEALRGFRLEPADICVVEMGGKDSVRAFMQVLSQLGLRTWALVDLDFLWRGAGELLRENADYFCFIEDLRRAVPDLQAGASEAERRQHKSQRIDVCRNALAAQRDAICEQLRALGVFVLRNGEIEDYVGLSRQKKGKYLAAVREVIEGTRAVRFAADIESIIDNLN